MKWILSVLGIAVLVVVGYFAAVMIGSELAGEVVVLRTQDQSGEKVETRLWIVDLDDRPWLRAGSPDSGWLKRIQAQPLVEMERSGSTGSYLAFVDSDKPARRDAVHELMASKYGFVDALVSLMRDGKKSIPIRMDAR